MSNVALKPLSEEELAQLQAEVETDRKETEAQTETTPQRSPYMVTDFAEQVAEGQESERGMDAKSISAENPTEDNSHDPLVTDAPALADPSAPQELDRVTSKDSNKSAVSPLDLINARKATPGTFSVEDVVSTRNTSSSHTISVTELISRRKGTSPTAQSVKDLIYERKYK